jgi:anti-sigma B factor antagonist
MSLEITQREREGIVILDLNGRITAGAEATVFRERVDSTLASGKPNVILNMAEVDYVDSTGLGALVMLATRLRKAEGNMRLLNVNRRNIELLVMTKLSTIFEIFDDEQEAVNSFFPNRKIRKFDILSFVQQIKDEG